MAVSKLFDLFEQYIGKMVGGSVQDKSYKYIQGTMKEIFNLENSAEGLYNSLKEVNKQIKEHEKSVLSDAEKAALTAKERQEYEKAEAAQKNKLNAQRARAEAELRKNETKQTQLIDQLSKKTGISADSIEELIEKFHAQGEEGVKAAMGTEKFKKGMKSLVTSLGVDLKELALGFFTLTGMLTGTIVQLTKLNEDLIRLQRQTGGALGAKQLGYDRFGNNKVGAASLATQTALNNISVDEMFQGLQGFASGQIMGMADDLNKSGKALQEFGLQQGRLIKLYGVSSSSIAAITKNMTQLNGVGIKELNKNLLHGTDIARKAGVSVNQFFENLSQVSGLTSELYIRGGFQGMEQLSMTLTKLGISANTVSKQMEDYKEITDIFEKTNQAVALGLNNYSNNVARVFAKMQLGDPDGALQIKLASLAKDISDNGLFDGNAIQSIGLKQLNAAGLSKEEKEAVLRLLQQNKNLGISFEKLTGQIKMTAAEQRKLRIEEIKNMTIQEKLRQSWDIFKANFLDPLGQIIGPLLDVGLTVLNTMFKLLGIILRPIVGMFQIFGKVLSPVVDFFSWIGGMVDDVSKTAKNLGWVGDVALGVVQALVALRIASWAAAKAQNAQSLFTTFSGGFGNFFKGLSGKLSKLPFIGKFFNSATAAATTASTATAAASGGGFFSKLFGGGVSGAGGVKGFLPNLIKGAGIGTVISMAGGAVKNLIGGKEGTTRQKIGGTIGDIANGAGIGMMFGPLGALIGGGIGGLFGIAKNFFGWFRKRTEKKDSQEDKMKVAMASIAADPFEIAKNVVNTSRTIDNQAAEKAQYERMQKVFQPKVQVHNNVGIFNKGTYIRNGGY